MPMMSSLKSLEDELRAKVCKISGVDRVIESGGICPEIAGSEAGEESSISCKSTSRSNKISFASNGKGDYKP